MNLSTYFLRKPRFPSGDTGLNGYSEVMKLNCNYGTKLRKEDRDSV